MTAKLIASFLVLILLTELSIIFIRKPIKPKPPETLQWAFPPTTIPSGPFLFAEPDPPSEDPCVKDCSDREVKTA